MREKSALHASSIAASFASSMCLMSSVKTTVWAMVFIEPGIASTMPVVARPEKRFAMVLAWTINLAAQRRASLRAEKGVVPACVPRPETVTRNHLNACTPGNVNQIAQNDGQLIQTFHDPNPSPLFLQDRALLDMQLEVRGEWVVAI